MRIKAIGWSGLLASAVLLSLNVQATEIDVGNPDLSVRWDNTLKYSNAFRLKRASGALINDDTPGFDKISLDDGDRDFHRGLISNRLDLLSEFDLAFRKSAGLRVSGAAWYDTVYNRGNDNDQPARVNATSVPPNQFTKATRDLHGRKAEFLDAFVYANNDDGNIRLGRHTLLYGETLFFGANGIAGTQAPVDAVKLLSVPNSQFKELILPVAQVSGQYRLTGTLTAGAYYQFEWRRSRIPGVGSYFSNADLFDAGGENFLFAPGTGAPRAPDVEAKNSGQGGVQLRWRPEDSDVEYGFYAVRYHDKGFQVYLRPAGLAVPGLPLNYQLLYPEGIRSYGASFSTEVGGFNVAGEASLRDNVPLVSDPQADPTGVGGIGDRALYAVGRSAHINLSTIVLTPRTALWNSASVVAELAWNRRLSVSRNPDAVAANSSRDAWGLRVVATPQWFQVISGLDLSAPIGLGYNHQGNSSVVANFNGGVKRGGDFSLGLQGTYQQLWKFGLNYTHFLGTAGPALAGGRLTYLQSLADRDFLSFSLQRTF